MADYRCPTCGYEKSRIKKELAGRKVKCPSCGLISRLPDVAAEERADIWFLRDIAGDVYGPASRTQLDEWFSKGAINESCFIKSEGNPWSPATSIYAQLPREPNNCVFCKSCGQKSTNPDAAICLSCGAFLQKAVGGSNQRLVKTGTTLSPTMAVLLSLLLVGLSQIIMGQVLKGVVMLAGAVVIGALTGCISIPVIWVINSVDAYRIATKLSEGKQVTEWEFF